MADKLEYADAVKNDECALITEMFGRRLAHPLALLAHKLGMSPNAVTVIAGLCWIASTPLAVVAGHLYGSGRTSAGLAVWFACGFLWNAGYILDIADGSLARMTGKASRRGFYLDYVFHLLFKPAFLLSVGIGLYLCHGGGIWWLLLAVLSVPANWSAPASAVEHVLCEEYGKGKLVPFAATDGQKHALWLGVTDMNESAGAKASSAPKALRAIAAEVLSYYGQFSFFSITVLADILLHGHVKAVMPATSISFAAIAVFMIIRTPFRIMREYRRIAAAD